ncbi:paraquat-inducible protein A [uncultured Paraglaciecola sp.]|uniref:paraquat-inducible protein A n=1 Tax=uncultured Paraglaciecola sp. TaxID=1765024 RepID=UPI0025986610|nr:paraquat-inducible protein A [uncultured Paraglaciecola sp.]
MIRKHLGFALNLAALGLFFPGVLLTMFSFNMEMMVNLGASDLTSSLIDKELSIATSIQELWEDDRVLVASLIFAFSVCIPLLKTLLVSIAYFVKHAGLEKKLLGLVAAIGKWSMADVFVVAIFLAVMSTNHADTSTNEQFTVFGFSIALDISSQTLSAIGDGFYYFTGYCLLSLLATQLSLSASKKATQKLQKIDMANITN